MNVLKLARVREIATHREYFSAGLAEGNSPINIEDKPFSYALPPRCFVITFGDEWAKPETYVMQLATALKVARNYSDYVWVNAALSLRHGMYHYAPYTSLVTRFKANALLEFVLYVNRAVSSIPTAKIDVRRYRPTTPTGAE